MRKVNIKQSTEQGLTLMESMVALVILSISITMLTPPIMLSLATRVRAHQAGQARQLAQGEIDRVRAVLEKGETAYESLDDFNDQLPPDAGSGAPGAVNAPTSFEDCTDDLVASTASAACRVDLNRDGQDNFGDFVVQTFRTRTQFTGVLNNIPIAFWMGVRVYTWAAADSGNLSTEPASLGVSSRIPSENKPLIVLYTPIIRSDRQDSSLLKYRDFINDSMGP